MTTRPPAAKLAARPPLRWRAAAWIAACASALLLAYVIAYWGWHWLGPAPPIQPVAATPERLAPAIVASPLFGRTGPAGPVTMNKAAAPQGDTRLLGVFAERDGTGHALFRVGDRGPVLVQAGEEISSGVVLAEVHPDRVHVREHGETRVIALRTAAAVPVPAASRGAPSRACAVPPGYRGPVYRLNAELLTGIAARPDGWKALLAPVPGGLAIRDGSAFATMLGMKAGDRMEQANGIALAGIEDVLVAFVKPLVASQMVHVAGVRDGKPAAWVFLNAGACPG